MSGGRESFCKFKIYQAGTGFSYQFQARIQDKWWLISETSAF